MAINVSDNNPRINYTATSGQTVFTVPFEFFASTDLTVYVGGSVLATSAYTVTGGSGSTGTVTTDSGQTAGAEIAIVRDVPLERTTDLTSSYSASSLNDQLDRIVTQVADLDDRVSRSVSLNDYEVGVSLDLPATASRLGKTIQFNSSTGALEIGPSGDELTSIASIASEITALDGIKANITTVAGAISNVNSVGSNISSVTSVASSISNVNTVNTNIANVNSVAGSISDLNDVADSLDQVELVGGSISNVDIVGPAIANVNTVAGDISNINTLAGISANITTVAGITADISTVNSNSTNINLVATNIDDVNDVANVITKVTTVADNIANVNTVAPSVGYLSTVANNIANINTLAPISADITTVAGIASAVSNAAANAAAAEAAKVAAELAADNFDDTYLGAKSSDPTVDNDGDSLNAGDLYFSTTDNNLKIYSGSAWQDAALDSSSFVQTTGDSMTGNLTIAGNLTLGLINQANRTFFMGSNYSSYFNIGTFLNSTLITSGSAISDSTLKFRVADGGTETTILNISKTGIDVTGTVTMDGGSTSADFTFGDNDKAIFGAGSDLQIYHDGSNSYITDTGTGDLLVLANKFVVKSASGASSFIQADPAATDVKLFYGNVEKLATTSTGVDITGTLTSDGLTLNNGATIVAINSSNVNSRLDLIASRTSSNLASFLFKDDQDRSKLSIAQSGDISFYEDTGTTAKFFWDASAEKARFGGTTDDFAGSIGLSGQTFTIEGYLNNSLVINAKPNASNEGVILQYNGTDGFILNNQGNVGIGTSSPDEAFHLEGSGTTRILIEDSTSNKQTKLVNTSTGVAVVATSTDSSGNNLQFWTQNGATTSEAARIDSSGNIGIGTSSPSALLHLADTSGGTIINLQRTNTNTSGGVGTIQFSALDDHAVASIAAFGDGNDEGAHLSFRTTSAASTNSWYSGTTERMRITSSGSVGIGTSSPSAPLTVQTSSTTNLDIKSTATNGTAQARFSNDARTYSLGIDGSDSFFVYDATGTSTRMTITSAGDLLVGKASADFGSARGVELRPTGNSYFTNADGNALRLNRLNSDGEILTFRKDGADVGIIGTTSSNAYISGTTRGLHFTGTAGIIPCNEAGASRDADTDLGKSSTRFKDLYLSGDVFVNKTTKTAAGSGILLDGNGFAYFVRDGAVQILLGNDDTGGTSQEAIRFVRASSDVGSIDTTSTSTAYNTSSDYRLKTDAQPMTGATDRIKQLNPVNFEWVANGTRVDGFLAHEAQAVVPEAVTGAKDAMRDEEYEVTPAVTDDDGNVVTEAVMGTRSVPDYQGIDQSKLVPLLVATIQELEARITALENA